MSDLVVMTREDLDYLVQRLVEALADSTDAPLATILDVTQVSEPRLVEAYDVAVTLTTLDGVYDTEDDCDCLGCTLEHYFCDCE